jgi:PBP1b-binding outer membrane lipoprotein LpoB
MLKISITLIVLSCLFLTGCSDYDQNACELDAYKEYNQVNVKSLNNYNFIVYEEKTDTFKFIRKGNNSNCKTSKSIDITDFVKSKNVEK